MADHLVNRKIEFKFGDGARRDIPGQLLLVVRKDWTSWKDIQLADTDGYAEPLTGDEDGYLRVRTSPKSEVANPSVEQRLGAIESLLRRLVAIGELMIETDVPDPEGDAYGS